MSKLERTRRLRLLRSRRLTIDVLHYNRKVPTCAHDRRCDLSRVAELRSRLPVRVSWSLLFIKAFARVAEKRRVLRQQAGMLRSAWKAAEDVKTRTSLRGHSGKRV